MTDPTSDLGEDVDEDSAPTCETCGKKIIKEPDHRVVSWVEGDAIEHRHFCGEECEAAWHEHHAGK